MDTESKSPRRSSAKSMVLTAAVLLLPLLGILYYCFIPASAPAEKALAPVSGSPWPASARDFVSGGLPVSPAPEAASASRPAGGRSSLQMIRREESFLGGAPPKPAVPESASEQLGMEGKPGLGRRRSAEPAGPKARAKPATPAPGRPARRKLKSLGRRGLDFSHPSFADPSSKPEPLQSPFGQRPQ